MGVCTDHRIWIRLKSSPHKILLGLAKNEGISEVPSYKNSIELAYLASKSSEIALVVATKIIFLALIQYINLSHYFAISVLN